MLRTTLILILGLISANIYGISAIALPFKLSNELEIDNHPCKAENIKVSVIKANFFYCYSSRPNIIGLFK